MSKSVNRFGLIIFCILFNFGVMQSSHLETNSIDQQGRDNQDELSDRIAINTNRRLANFVDVMVFTIAGEFVESVISSSSSISLSKNALVGVSSWLTGEVLETAVKHYYKKLIGENLRDDLGKFYFLGIEFDKQRLFRRITSMFFVVGSVVALNK